MDTSVNWTLRSKGYQQFTAGQVDAATALTVPAGTSVAIIKPSAQAIRLRDDGTNPTTTIGYPVAVGVEFVYSSSSIGTVKIIGQAINAVVDILYYGP
jgi:hypothetical protein